jgi:sarcosine oxidase subunit beta
MGASIAYHLSARGQSGVVLLEKEEYFGTGATGRCAGGVRYQFATEINIRLSIASLPMLADFEYAHGQAIHYQECGYLFLLDNEADIAQFQKNVDLQNRLGVGTEWLTGDEIRKRLPQMRLDDIRAGTFNSRDGLVDPNSVTMGYIKHAQELGTTALTGIEVSGIHTRSGRVTGVETNLGPIDSPFVIDAAGPWSGLIGNLAGVEIPITPIRRQMLTTTPLPAIPKDFPFVIDFSRSLYFHREGEGLLTGMSNPNENAGFSQEIDPDWELASLEAAAARLPLLEHAGLLAHWAGLYEVTPDAHPIFGETPVGGFFVCTGFSGHGFMHGPIAGLLMSEIVLDGASRTVDVSSLDLARFDEGRLVREYNVI